MIVRTEMRMAIEIDKGQQSGDVAKRGGDRDSRMSGLRIMGNTLENPGVSRQRLAEWPDVRAGMPAMEGAIEKALARQYQLTYQSKAEIWCARPELNWRPPA
jgi:hypothetical protein